MGDAISVIRARRADIAQAILDLQDEDKDLATAESVLKRLEGGARTKRSVTAPDPRPSASPPSPAATHIPPTQRAVVIEVLRASEEAWLQSGEIVSRALRLWGAQVPERSLRPLLTTMKREQVIVRDGRLIALRDRITPRRGLRTDV